MSEFFEPPPEPPERLGPTQYRLPPWIAAPRGTLPGVVPLERVIAQTEKVAVCVTRVAAYPTGFEFDIVTMAARGVDEVDPMLFEHHHRMRMGRRDIPPELLRFGVQFTDGAKATNTSGQGFPHGRGVPEGPVLSIGGGGGGGGDWNQTVWVWPLPPPGPLRFVCEWPVMDIKLTHIEIDSQLITDASERALVIFSDEDLPEPPEDDDGQAEFAIIR